MKTLKELGIINDIQNVMITPELAAEFLQHNTTEDGENREAKESKVQEYTHYMLTGQWAAKCDGKIAFDSNERLINGQKRCMAIIRSGIPALFTIERDFSNSIFVDNAQKRDGVDNNIMFSTADGRKIDKTICNKTIQAIVRTLLYTKTKEGTVYPSEIVEAMKEWEPVLIEMLPIFNYKIKGCKTAMYSALLEARLCGQDFDTILDFTEILYSGVTNDSSCNSAEPIIAFRDRILSGKFTKGGGGSISKDIFGRTQYALKKYIENNNLRRTQCHTYWHVDCSFLNKKNTNTGEIIERY